jgi:hypothetical protein
MRGKEPIQNVGEPNRKLWSKKRRARIGKEKGKQRLRIRMKDRERTGGIKMGLWRRGWLVWMCLGCLRWKGELGPLGLTVAHEEELILSTGVRDAVNWLYIRVQNARKM